MIPKVHLHNNPIESGKLRHKRVSCGGWGKSPQRSCPSVACRGNQNTGRVPQATLARQTRITWLAQKLRATTTLQRPPGPPSRKDPPHLRSHSRTAGIARSSHGEIIPRSSFWQTLTCPGRRVEAVHYPTLKRSDRPSIFAPAHGLALDELMARISFSRTHGGGAESALRANRPVGFAVGIMK